MWLNPKIVNPLPRKDADNLIIDHFEESQESDDSMYAAFAGGKYINEIKSWLLDQFVDDLVLLFLDCEGVLNDGVHWISLGFFQPIHDTLEGL